MPTSFSYSSAIFHVWQKISHLYASDYWQCFYFQLVAFFALATSAYAGYAPLAPAPLAYAAAPAPLAYAAPAPLAYASPAAFAYRAAAPAPFAYSAAAPAPFAYRAAAPVAYAAPAVAKLAAPAPIAYAAPAFAKVAAPVAYAAPVAKAVAAEEYDPNPQYSYGYDVQDSLTGDSKSQVESRSGDVVQGSYSLTEPDGTRRTVDYVADPVNGFNAVVRKEPLAVAAAPLAAAPVAYAAPVAKVAAAPVAYSSKIVL